MFIQSMLFLNGVNLNKNYVNEYTYYLTLGMQMIKCTKYTL